MNDASWPSSTEFYLDGEPHIAPATLMSHFCEGQGISGEALGVRPTMIATFSARLNSYLAEAAGATAVECHTPATWPDVCSTDELGIVRMTIGAPAAVAASEEMIALGMKRLLIVAASGSLQPDLPIGSVALPVQAIREDGTSHHYAAANTPAVASVGLLSSLEQSCLEHGLQPRRGLHWTTDAIYREHLQKIERYAEQGVLSVDMEIAALYTLAAYRNIECAAVVVISDELYGDFRIGYRSPEFIENLGKAGLAALDVARARS